MAVFIEFQTEYSQILLPVQTEPVNIVKLIFRFFLTESKKTHKKNACLKDIESLNKSDQKEQH